ncbi:MAG: energy transducer TonB, partial [Nitrospinaceae bacterium]|nr:energy transducer TonB [Nitrospinaceae bacterium]
PTLKTPKSNGFLEALKKLDGKKALATPNVVEELAQVARLEKPKIKPAKPIKQKPITEKTLRELETLKNKKIKDKRTVAPVPLHEDLLEDFEELKVKESLPEKPQAPQRDLLKELEQVAKMDVSPVPDVKTEEPRPTESTQKSDEVYDSILEKLDSLSVDSEPVKVEISSARLDSSSFQSKLRTLPEASPARTESGTGSSYVFAKKEGVPGADARSLYVGMIQDKIYKNWKEPLAEEHNQEAVISFYIFPRGNIDKPIIKKSSGVEALDTLAVRAVLDSVPFPEFPEQLKMSNLHVNIYFKYVPKD